MKSTERKPSRRREWGVLETQLGENGEERDDWKTEVGGEKNLRK